MPPEHKPGALGAERLAGLPGLTREDAQRIHTAGLLHDIGKIGVPGAVLLKQGALDDREFGLIRRHPEAGATILQPLGFLTDLLPVVRHHRERFGGKGYPAGLGGKSSPWERASCRSSIPSTPWPPAGRPLI